MTNIKGGTKAETRHQTPIASMVLGGRQRQGAVGLRSALRAPGAPGSSRGTLDGELDGGKTHRGEAPVPLGIV